METSLLTSLFPLPGAPDLVWDIKELARTLPRGVKTFPTVALRCAYEENCLSSSAESAFNNTRLGRAGLGHSRRVMRFSAKVHNIGTASYRPYLSKNAWKWHSCHAHFHSDEEFAFYDLIGKHLAMTQ